MAMTTDAPQRPVLVTVDETDWDLSTVDVVILGAGFSAACTDGRMPLMGNFFSGIEERQYPLLCGFIREAEGVLATANVENVLLLLEQMRKSPDKLLHGWGENWGSECRNIERQLTKYILCRLKSSLHVAPKNCAVLTFWGKTILKYPDRCEEQIWRVWKARQQTGAVSGTRE